MRTLAVVTNLPTPYRIPLFRHLAGELRGAGWELEVVFGSRTNARRRWEVDAGHLGFRHRFLEARNVSLGSDRIVNTYSGLAPVLREIEPAAIVCTGFSRGTMTAARHARRAGVPLVLWSGAVEGSEPGFLRRVQRRWLVGRADAFLAYGSAARDYLAGLGAPHERIHIAWNTVDTERFLGLRGAPAPAPGEPLRLLTVGYLEQGKRLDLLLRAVKAANAQGPPVTLDVVGDGPARPALEAQARDLPVRFLGYRAYDALGACYEGAHAFAFPTEYDVWGLVLVEAMAAGLPAVASTRAGATRDLVVDGETGFAVNFEDTDAAAARIRDLGAAPARAADMGQAARNRIREHFTLEKSAAGWLELLERYQPLR